MFSFRSIVIFTGTIIILLAFVLAFRLKNKKGLPRYFKFFYYMPLIGLLFSANAIFNYYVKYDSSEMFIFQNSFSLLEFFLMSFFFYTLLKVYGIGGFLKIVFFTGLGIIVLLLYNNKFNSSIYQLYAVHNLIISIFCIYYNYKLFTEKPYINLRNDATFWIITGLFVSCSINVPQYAIQEYVFTNYGPKISSNVFAAVNIVIMFKYLFFIKASWCAVKFPEAQNQTAFDNGIEF